MTSETDAEFVERMKRDTYMIGTDEYDEARLFALARRGAAMEKLEVTKTRIRRGKDGIDYIETFFVFTEPLPTPASRSTGT